MYYENIRIKLINIVIILLLCLNLYFELNKKMDISYSNVKVEIKGKVLNPGVYEVEYDSRVEDIINLSGGLVDNADISNINLSKKVEDEMVIIINDLDEKIVYIENECVCPIIKSLGCMNYEESINKISKKISINIATLKELMTLPGIGQSKAEAIINYRVEHGSFNNLDDLKNVKGIGNAIYEKIKDYIVL